MVIRETNVDDINRWRWLVGPTDNDVERTAVIVRQRRNAVHQAVSSKVVVQVTGRSVMWTLKLYVKIVDNVHWLNERQQTIKDIRHFGEELCRRGNGAQSIYNGDDTRQQTRNDTNAQ